MDLPCQLPCAVSFILPFHHHVCPGICLGGELQLMLALPTWKYRLSRYCCGWGQGDWPMAYGQPWIMKFRLRDGDIEEWTRFLMNVNGMNGLRDTESATFHQGLWSPQRPTHASPNTGKPRAQAQPPPCSEVLGLLFLLWMLPSDFSAKTCLSSPPQRWKPGSRNGLGQQIPSSKVYFTLCSLRWDCVLQKM